MIPFEPAPTFLEGWDWNWDVRSQQPSWRVLTENAKSLQARVGTGGVFKDYVGQAKALLEHFDLNEFVKAAESRSMVRAFFHAWISEPELAAATLRIRTIETLSASKAGISRLGTMALIQMHLTYFDLVDTWEPGLFHSVEQAIQAAVASQTSDVKFADAVESVSEHPELIIQADAASKASQLVISGDHSVEGLIADLNLSGFDAQRYRLLLNQEIFLRRIETADPNGKNDFLSEVSSDAVRKAPRSKGGFFGIDLLDALIRRPTSNPSLEWINAILDIGGDPRMSHTTNWTTWWSPLDASVRDTVTLWLSNQDFELFLRTIEEFGQKSGNEMLQRMYPDRAKFLRGLQKSGLVRSTRLFMPESARNFAGRTLPHRVLQTISRLEGDPNRSVIFIDCGSFHIVEGSHNFKIWVYDGPVNELLTSRERYSTNIEELRQPLADQYVRNGQLFKSVSHNGIWQYPVLQWLRQNLGITLDPSKMMTKTTYAEMRDKKGMP